MSLARSLLQAWSDPLVLLSSSASALPHPAQSTIFNKIQKMQQYSKSLKDGLDVLSSKVCKRWLQELWGENKKLFSFTVQIQNVSLKWFFPACLCPDGFICSGHHFTALPRRHQPRPGQDYQVDQLQLSAVLPPSGLSQDWQLPESPTLPGSKDATRDVLKSGCPAWLCGEIVLKACTAYRIIHGTIFLPAD